MNTQGTPHLTKDDLRRSMRASLRALPSGQAVQWSAEICLRLKEVDSWVPPPGGIVALFGGMPSEPDLLPLLPWLTDRGIRVAFFAITGEIMAPRAISHHSHLRAGQLGVLEPDLTASEPVDVENLDALLIPGVAFSPLNGARLGRGKGYYDRILATLPPARPCIGVCFHLQLQPSVPLESHDRHVHAIVTERGWINLPHPSEDVGAG